MSWFELFKLIVSCIFGFAIFVLMVFVITKAIVSAVYEVKQHYNCKERDDVRKTEGSSKASDK